MANKQGVPTSGEKGEQKTSLQQYGVNLTEIAKSGKLDPVIDRDAEIGQINRIERGISSNPSSRGPLKATSMDMD